MKDAYVREHLWNYITCHFLLNNNRFYALEVRLWEQLQNCLKTA